MPRSKTLEEMQATRRAKVEQLLASDLSVRRWCELNHVKPATMYDWLEYFRDKDPDVFGGYEIAHAGDGRRCWLMYVRKALRASRAIQPASPVPEVQKAPASFAIVDTADLRPAAPAPQPAPAPAAACSVTVRARGVEVDIPLAAGEAAIASVIKAVMGL